MGKTQEDYNLEIVKLNKELLEDNKRILHQNEKMALDEHQAKMELYDYQKRKILQDLREETEADILGMTKHFHDVFGHPVVEEPKIPTEDRWMLRIKLLREEIQEMEDALKEGNLVEVADAAADAGFILGGTIHEFGLGKKFPEIFSEVYRSNMSKMCNTEQEAQDTINSYTQKGIATSYRNNGHGGFVVTRDQDNKVLKYVGWSEPNIKSILDKR
jgi:predicted HAD superfamily Cof-like phosphohydrolase